MTLGQGGRRTRQLTKSVRQTRWMQTQHPCRNKLPIQSLATRAGPTCRPRDAPQGLRNQMQQIVHWRQKRLVMQSGVTVLVLRSGMRLLSQTQRVLHLHFGRDSLKTAAADSIGVTGKASNRLLMRMKPLWQSLLPSQTVVRHQRWNGRGKKETAILRLQRCIRCQQKQVVCDAPLRVGLRAAECLCLWTLKKDNLDNHVVS